LDDVLPGSEIVSGLACTVKSSAPEGVD